MSSETAVFSYRISLFARVFAKHISYPRLEIYQDKLSFMGRFKSQHDIQLISLGKNIEIVDGYFWSTITIELAQGQKIKFGGIGKKDTSSIVSTIQQYSYRQQKHYIKQFQSEFKQAYQDVATIIHQGSYIRQPQVEAWFDRYQHLKTPVSHPNINELIEPDYLPYIASLQQLFEQGPSVFAAYNDKFVNTQLAQFKDLFDHIESQPLTQNQREACVKNDKYNLVLAGAGTGKTSTMIGRAAYLIKANIAEPSQILMLAYGNDAAKEMSERIKAKLNIEGFTVKTFHSLGKHIITQVEGTVPSINKMAEDARLKDKFVDDQFNTLLKNTDYLSLAIKYFIRFPHAYKSQFNFKTLGAYNKYIRENEMRTLQGELVKSYEECEIANFLFEHGIAYHYEANYQVNTSGPDFRKYQPDFYLPEHGIYIEHFAVDENNHTPIFIDEEKYLDGMAWKRELHKKHNTPLIETYSYQKRQGVLLKQLKAKLLKHNVDLDPLPNEAILATLNEFGKVSAFSRLLSQLLGLLKSSFLSIADLAHKSAQHDDHERTLAALKLFEPIYNAYQQHLTETNTIDFDDMIIKSISYIKSKQYQSNFTHILVDEFQDISASRAQMIKALQNQQADNSLFCVGDDWQAIYQFTGSDVSITKQFEDHFGPAATTTLDTTFRFNNKIADVASRFIMQNPEQISKQIHSFNHVKQAAISLLKTAHNQAGVEQALIEINAKVKKAASVLILVRFSHDRPDISRLKNYYPKLKLKIMTTHASKGKEADYVIILGLQKGKFGFPSEKTNHPLLNNVLPKSDGYAHAEERRLFYVALTRAKHHVYLITDGNNASDFVRELLKDDYDIIQTHADKPHFQTKIADIPCRQCETGYMIAKDGQYGQFFACSDYPLCTHTQTACEWCHSNLIEKDKLKICENPKCNYVEPICPECNGKLKQRKSTRGTFWGCTNFRKDSEFSCSYTVNFIDLNNHI
ncbi:MAG: UvrD-helicase domain-containing protein [Piscirickettsiaceae bacterium]|nr:UvrD-helicase domain-containing protein [Piscirickettsiaceae bacterium]